MRGGVIGANWGRIHVKALREAGVDVVALVSQDEREARETAAAMDIPAALADPAELAALDLDVVTIATPARTHADVLAAVPDVPVICEKPAVGLSPLRPVPEGRSSPVWVNYAFGFLDASRRAADHLHRLGSITSAHVVSSYELPHLAFTPEEMFMELVPHPWSWLVRLFGAPEPRSRWGREEDAGDVRVAVECGDVPVRLESIPEPGLDGIRHDVVIEGVSAVMTLGGSYRSGSSWRFDPPTLMHRPHATLPGDARTDPERFGDVETAPPDPWYRANARSIGAALGAIRGNRHDPLLFDWDDALALDRTAQAVIRPHG
jgi:hypothetical protein